MATQLAKGHVFGTSGSYSYSGSAQANVQGVQIQHGSEVDRIKAQATGDTGSVIYSDEFVEINIDTIPEGATIAAATDSADLPPVPTVFTLSGWPNINVGSFTNFLNSSDWIYEGQGGGRMEVGGKMVTNLTLRRYKGITSPTVVSS